MIKKIKRAFTIVELVIVIAVIAILASVLIPTFSGIVEKANQNAALQTARSTLTNALNMSSTAQLAGKDSNGNYQTIFIVDGYAFGYTGNQMEAIDYPGESSSSISELEYGINYNAILISSNNIENGVIKNINQVISQTTDFGSLLKVVSLDDKFYLTDGTRVCELYLNSDFSKKVVVFTTFTGTISDETKDAVIEQANESGYQEKESGKGSSIGFGDLE